MYSTHNRDSSQNKCECIAANRRFGYMAGRQIYSFYAIAGVPKKNSSCIEPHTAVVVCCADGSAAEQTPTTREELGNENK